jgi:hypothetical protein
VNVTFKFNPTQSSFPTMSRPHYSKPATASSISSLFTCKTRGERG